MHRGAEDAEHPLMGPHVGQLIGHMVFHKVVFARQFRKLRAFFQRRLGRNCAWPVFNFLPPRMVAVYLI